MRKDLHGFALALVAIISTTISSQAQDRFAYVLSDVNQNTAGWTVLRKLNFETGVYSDAIFNGVDTKNIAYDAVSKKQLDVNSKVGVTNYSPMPFGTGVAAIAYD